MSEVILISILVIAVISFILILFLWKRVAGNYSTELSNSFKQILDENYLKEERLIKDEFTRNREESNSSFKQTREELNNSLKQNREEVSASLKSITDSLIKQLAETSKMQKNEIQIFTEQLNKLILTNEQKLEQIRDKIEERLKLLQDSNSQKLDEMRSTVDEKLQSTLEKRLGESFKLVSERLEQVHKGLGEMQNLAIGVGDLKKVLTNVKTRGIWGEIQLENLIEQILTKEQYAKNVITKRGSNERVEFAIRMPGKSNNKEEVCWLPIDAKFPMEDYQRLLSAQDLADAVLIEETSKAIENRIKNEAKSIFEKYIDPPNTIDVALLFLPVEGLFAEVLRRPGLFEKIQNEYKVILTGPTTLTAILNSLQMGFRTLAIEKRSSEVWSLLGAVKTEFGKFGDVLDKTQKKLRDASDTIDEASKRTRAIERKLRDVQVLPSSEQNGVVDEVDQIESSE